MIIKKTFVTTSKFILAAALLSQIYSFKNAKEQSHSINFSAFSNLTQNIKSVTRPSTAISSESENTAITNDIIKVIDKEISKKISRTRYSIRQIKSKVKETEIMTSTKNSNSENLLNYEINNSELINLYALATEEIAFSSFESIKLLTSYSEEIKDEVAFAQSSTSHASEKLDETTVTPPVEEKNKILDTHDIAVVYKEAASSDVSEVAEMSKEKQDEEMVMFDYSEKSEPTSITKTIDQKLYDRPLSKTVQQAISREIGSTPIKKAIYVNTQKTSQETRQQNPDQKYEENAQNFLMAPSGAESSRFVLRAKEINLSTQKKQQAYSFEFVPDYDRAERSDDQGSGEITFGYSLNEDLNTQTGVVRAHGMISTRTELNLVKNVNYEVPLINEEGMQKFLQKRGLSIEGNLIMLAVDPSVVDAEIDSRFAEKFFFDEKFNVLPSIANAHFVMFAGVKTGNIMIRYLLSNKENAQKIIYVGDGEMYYEDAVFANSARETFILTTRNLLGQKRKELVIDGEEISYFNTNITAKKKTLNAYEIKIPPLVSGMRKYLEFKHLRDSVFVGTSNEKEMEIPSNDFIAKVLEMNEINSLKDRCVVQINLSKEIRSIVANGKNRSGEMFVETSYLDKDGAFSRESFEMADKAFVTGDMEGQFNIKLDYTDGTTGFLKTFCSEGTYLVEQL